MKLFKLLTFLAIASIGFGQTYPVPPQWDGQNLKIETPEVYITIRRQQDGDGSAYVFAVITRGQLEVEDIFTNTSGNKLSFVIAPLADPPLGNRNFVGVYPVGSPENVMFIEVQSPGS